MKKVRFALGKRTGLGLAEALVSVLILGFVSMLFVSLVRNSSKGQKSVEGSLNFDILKTSLLSILRKPTTCLAGMQNVSAGTPKFDFPTSNIAPNLQVKRLVDGSAVMAEPGYKLDGSMKVKDVLLEKIPGTVPVVQGAETLYNVQLILSLQRNQEVAVGGGQIDNSLNPFRFMIRVNTTTHAITYCSGINGDTSTSGSMGSLLVLASPWVFRLSVPTGAYRVKVRLWGGGGSGGGSDPWSCDGAGGGGAGYSEKEFVTVPSQPMTIKVGRGGVASSGCVSGNSGQPSYFVLGPTSFNPAVDLYATGGGGGVASGGGVRAGGGAGQGFNGTTNLSGNPGQHFTTFPEGNGGLAGAVPDIFGDGMSHNHPGDNTHAAGPDHLTRANLGGDSEGSDGLSPGNGGSPSRGGRQIGAGGEGQVQLEFFPD